jgi:hypothetical protein
MKLPNRTDPLTVSRKRAAVELGDISEDTLDRLIAAGKLEKIQVGPRKVAIKWASILKLIGEVA